MKKLTNKIMLLSAGALLTLSLSVFIGCASDVEDYSSSNNTQLIDFDPSVPLTNLSPEEQELYFEAQDLFGKFVTFDGQQFVTSCRDYRAAGLSKRVYDHFATLMKGSNEFVSGYIFEEVKPNHFVPVSLTPERYFAELEKNGGKPVQGLCLPRRIKTRSELGSEYDNDSSWSVGAGGNSSSSGGNSGGGGTPTPKGGVNTVKFGWSYADVYMSNSTLLEITRSTASGTAIAGGITAKYPSVPGLVITVACGVIAGEAGYYQTKYKNGIIVRIRLSPGQIAYDMGTGTGRVRPQ